MGVESGISAVFLDRDGVIIEEIGHLRRMSEVELIPGSADAIKMLNDRSIPVIVVTNQSVIARGICSEEEVKEIHAYLSSLLMGHGAKVNRFLVCPHHPTFGTKAYRILCDCRKPNPGLLLRAAQECDLDLDRSYMIGDKETDIMSGYRAGCKTILTTTGYGNYSRDNWEDSSLVPDLITKDLYEAIKSIL